jgi:hypothetical protein
MSRGAGIRGDLSKAKGEHEMSASVNKCILLGNVGADPVVRLAPIQATIASSDRKRLLTPQPPRDGAVNPLITAN